MHLRRRFTRRVAWSKIETTHEGGKGASKLRLQRAVWVLRVRASVREKLLENFPRNVFFHNPKPEVRPSSGCRCSWTRLERARVLRVPKVEVFVRELRCDFRGALTASQHITSNALKVLLSAHPRYERPTVRTAACTKVGELPKTSSQRRAAAARIQFLARALSAEQLSENSAVRTE